MISELAGHQLTNRDNIEQLAMKYKQIKNAIVQNDGVYVIIINSIPQNEYQQLTDRNRLNIEYRIVSTIDPSIVDGQQLIELFRFYFQFLNNYMLMCKQNGHLEHFKQNWQEFIDNGMIDQLLALLNTISQQQNYLKFQLILINNLLINIDEYQQLDRNPTNVNKLILKPIEQYLMMSVKIEPENDVYFEWIFMIIRNLLQMENGNLKYLVEYGDGWLGRKVLELLFNGFNRLIDQRMQPSMVYGLQPHIQEIKEQYSQQQDSNGRITICQQDLEWLIGHYKQLVALFIELYNENDDYETIHSKLNELVYDLHLILKLFCQISFIGGYNVQVQQIFTNRKIQNTNLELLRHLKSNSRNYNEKQKERCYEQIIEEQNHNGILCSIIRLMSNMCHINRPLHDQVVEQDSLKEWIGLSQPNDHNPMIREWTIVLIRYLSESSSVQEQLQKLKVIDFEEKSKQFISKYVQQQDQQDDQIQSIIEALDKRQNSINQSINQ